MAGKSRKGKDEQTILASVGEAVTDAAAGVKDKVREGIGAAAGAFAGDFDLKEQFRRHPVAWSAAAVAVGLVVGPALYRAARKTDAFDRLLEEVSDLGDQVVDELSWVGGQLADAVTYAKPALVTALAGAAVPFLTRQASDAFGVDISRYITPGDAGRGGKKRKGGPGRKKGKKKQGKKDG